MSPVCFGAEYNMIPETMTKWERIQATVSLEKTDRVPVLPMLEYYALRYSGLTLVELRRKPHLWYETVRKLYDALGGWDGILGTSAYFPGMLVKTTTGSVAKAWTVRGTDIEDSELQYMEHEVMTIEDYDEIIDRGWTGFLEEFLPRILAHSLPQVNEGEEKAISLYRENAKLWDEIGVPTLFSTVVLTPMHVLSGYRSFTQFTLDLFRRPEKVLAAMDAMVPDLIDIAIDVAKRAGGPGVWLVCERGGGAFYSPTFFERFDLPYLKHMVEAFVSEGFITMVYWEGDWTLNLPYLTELPKGKCIFGTDGSTDLFKAKEILRDKVCILGDVPPDLLQLGTPSDVEAYVKRLIDEVGEGGGFILSTGSAAPRKAKFDNIKKMLDVGKSYLPRLS